MCGFCLERFPIPLGAWDGLRCFIVALPEPSIYLFNFQNIIKCPFSSRSMPYHVVVIKSLSNKNIIMSSFKSSGDIQKKEGGPDSCFE